MAEVAASPQSPISQDIPLADDRASDPTPPPAPTSKVTCFKDWSHWFWGAGIYNDYNVDEPVCWITFHASAYMLMALGALVYFVSNTDYVDVDLPWGNSLDRWMYLATMFVAVSYAANTVQMLLLKLTRHLFEDTLYIRTYFALRSALSSISVGAVTITLQHAWHRQLSFGESTDRYIERLFRVTLVLICFDIYRKLYIQHAVLKLNGAHYRERLATFKFRSQALTAILRTEPSGAPKRFPSMSTTFVERQVMFPNIVFDDHTPFTVLLTEFLSNKWEDELFTSNDPAAQVPNESETKRSRAINALFAAFDASDADEDCKDNTTKLWEEDLRRFFMPDAAQALLEWLGQKQGYISKASAMSAVKAYAAEGTSIQRTVDHADNFSFVVSALANTIFNVFAAILTLMAFDYSVQNLLLTFGTLIATVAFAFGTTIKGFVESVVFLLVSRPFDVGDRIQIGDHEGMKHWVEDIRPLYTTLRSTYGKHSVVPNSLLASQQIYNLSREGPCAILITFQCSSKIGMDKLRRLTAVVQRHVRKHEFDWKPNVSLILNEITDSNQLSFSFWTTCRHRHSQGGLIFSARTELMVVLQDEMNRLGVTWNPPTYHVVTESGKSIV